MGTPSEHQFKHRGMRVRLVHLPAPWSAYAFFFNEKNFSHCILTLAAGSVDLVFKEGSYTANVPEIHYLHGDCLVRAGRAGKVTFWLLRFTDDFAEATMYNVLAEASSQLVKERRFPILADSSTLKIIRKLLELLHKHQDNTASAYSGTICELTFNLLFGCFAELQHLASIGGARGLLRKELVAMRFFKLLNDKAGQHHDVRYYARELCMAQGNLAKVLKEVTGRAPKALIKEKLISLAKDLLDSTVQSIYSIAEDTGFKSSSAFITFFRSQTGLSPNEYRNRNTR